MSATVQFWILLAVLNSYYFFPRYLLEIFQSQFIPLRAFSRGSLGQRLRHLLIRPNYDIFRICIDLFALSVLYPLFLDVWIHPVAYTALLAVYVGVTLIYQVYYHAFHRIYHLDPVFFHDFLMLKTATQIFIHEFSGKNLIMLCTAGMIGISAGLCVYAMINVAPFVSFGSGSWIVIGLISAGALYSLLHYPYSKYPQLTFQSPLQSLIRNIRISRRSRHSVAALTLKYMTRFNVAPEVHLTVKPNVWIFIVESYGRIAIDDPALGPRFLSQVPLLEARLRDAGFSACSQFTLSPVTGGASWISYTSMMYGLNVRNQGVYTTMLKNKYMDEYDSLFHWLKRQGYVTFRISSLGGYEKMDIPYESYSRLYGVDHWIRYADLDYNGPHYGFGPSPPDQYALWKGDEIASRIAGDVPRAMFFITQNSHTPYDSPTGVADDWRLLNDGSGDVKKPSLFWSRPKFDKYADAIAYQLDVITDFIARNGAREDIFILMGDHQPPSLSRHLDNFHTPVHIVSGNPGFLESWKEYGFREGLVPDPQTQVIRQEAIHWALLRSMIRNFGPPEARLPGFLNEGIPY